MRAPNFNSLDIQSIIQLGISLPIITMIFTECVLTLAAMYIDKRANHTFARDFFFICCVVVCLKMLMDSWLKTLVVCTQERCNSVVEEISIFRMPKLNKDEKTAKQTAATTTQEATTTSQAEAATSTEAATTEAAFAGKKPEPGSPLPGKAPSTPSAADESKGPNEEQ